MIVADMMTREVITVAPSDRAADAAARARAHRIRHLPVVEVGRLVGIVTDRELRDAAPNSALGVEAAQAAAQLRVADLMRREVITTHPLDRLADAARVLSERRIGCLPVVEGDRLVGIITETDVLRCLAQLMGATEPGSSIEVQVPNRPGQLAAVADLIRDLHVNIVSVLTMPVPEDSGPESGECPPLHQAARKRLLLRLGTIDPRRVVAALARAGFEASWGQPKPDPDGR